VYIKTQAIIVPEVSSHHPIELVETSGCKRGLVERCGENKSIVIKVPFTAQKQGSG